ncbi:MAG: STAS domain-containing protein [Isosphaeraceae bacterium]
MFSIDLESVDKMTDRPEQCPVCGDSVGSVNGQTPCPRCGHLLWFSSERLGDITVVHLSDNRVAIMELLDLLDINLLDGGIGTLVLDLGGIQTVSSAVLGKLVKLSGRARSVAGRLAFCQLHADLKRVLQITRLDQVFDIHDSLDDALASLSLAAD